MPGSSLDWGVAEKTVVVTGASSGIGAATAKAGPGCVRTPMLQRGPGGARDHASSTSCHRSRRMSTEARSSPMVAGSHNRALGLRTVESVNRLGTARTRLAALAESRGRPSGYLAIWVATGVLFAVSPLLASGSVSEQRLALDAAVRRDPRDRGHRADARDPAARPRPVRAGDDHADRRSSSRSTRTATATSCRPRSGSSCSRASAPGSSAASRSPASASRRSSPRSASTRCFSAPSTRSRAARRPGRRRRAWPRSPLDKTAGIPNTVIVARADRRRRRRGDAQDDRREALRRRRRQPARRATPPASASATTRSRRTSSPASPTAPPGSCSPASCGRRASTPATTICCRRSRPSCSAARRSRAGRAASSRPAIGALFLTQLEQVVLGMGADESVAVRSSRARSSPSAWCCG